MTANDSLRFCIDCYGQSSVTGFLSRLGKAISPKLVTVFFSYFFRLKTVVTGSAVIPFLHFALIIAFL